LRSKYGNIRTEVNGIKFASKKEAGRYMELAMLQKAGYVDWFICQPRFNLPGGIKYYADFLVVWKDRQTGIEDVKGYDTRVSKMKRKMVEDLYPITIELK